MPACTRRWCAPCESDNSITTQDVRIPSVPNHKPDHWISTTEFLQRKTYHPLILLKPLHTVSIWKQNLVAEGKLMLEGERIRKHYYCMKVTVETLAWIKKGTVYKKEWLDEWQDDGRGWGGGCSKTEKWNLVRSATLLQRLIQFSGC